MINVHSKNAPKMITLKIDEDKISSQNGFKYYHNYKENLRFIDYYVPFQHMTREQVSSILGRDISGFSTYIYNYRTKNKRGYFLPIKLFEIAISEIEEKIKRKPVILVDLLGFHKNPTFTTNNFIFVDAKTLNKGHLIEKKTNESVKRKPDEEAKEILRKKYVLNKQLSATLQTGIKECYIFDDVYTRGNTTNRIKELIIEHNKGIKPKFHIITYAKTMRYKTNTFKFSDIINNNKKNVLFVCNKNMTRSLLAEAIAKNEFKSLTNKYNFYSVGIQKYAGREVCDYVYNYIVSNDLYDVSLKPQRLHTNDYTISNMKFKYIIDKDWLVIVLDKDIYNHVIKTYMLNEKQVYLYDMPDICKYDKPVPEYFRDVEFLADEIRKMLKEVFHANEKTLRIITWKEMLQRHPKFFNSFVKELYKKNIKAAWQAKIYKFLNENMTDEDIIDFLVDSDSNLLSDDRKEEMRNAFQKIYNELEVFYKNKNVKFITSLDKEYPKEFKTILKSNYNSTKTSTLQYIPNIFVFEGNLHLLTNKAKKLAIIGTRECKNIKATKLEIRKIRTKYPDAICVTGLASGVDSMGVNEFDNSICFIGEDLTEFIRKKQKDKDRFAAKQKVIKSGLILSHKLPHEKMSPIDYKNALLERNLFVVLLANSVHPIEFGIKSGTISAITHAIKNNKAIYTPKILVEDNVITKYKSKIMFY